MRLFCVRNGGVVCETVFQGKLLIKHAITVSMLQQVSACVKKSRKHVFVQLPNVQYFQVIFFSISFVFHREPHSSEAGKRVARESNVCLKRN